MKIQYDIGIVSGYFDPLHFGHIEYIKSAKEKSKFLVVIVNNDHQVNLKKSVPFMDDFHRSNIMNNIKGVGFSIISHDTDLSQCETLKYIRLIWPDKNIAFFNSGDRIEGNLNISEKELCKKLNIDFILLNQPKKYSSSELLKNVYEHYISGSIKKQP